MHRDDVVAVAWLSLSAIVLLGAGLSGCQGQQEDPVGPVCPKCGPSTGGETGDFGAILIPCDALVSASIEDAEADGFDVAEFERRLARPIDARMSWRRLDEERDEAATQRELRVRGYEVETRIEAGISTTSSFRYRRVDRSLCEATDCEACASIVWVDVSVEMQTLDGAVQASLQGWAAQYLRGEGPGADPTDPYRIVFNTSADLRDVVGTLRFAPPPSGATFHGRLNMFGRLFPDSYQGELSFVLDVDDEGTREWAVPWVEGTYRLPLAGDFASALRLPAP